MAGGADLLLSFLDGVGEGGRCELGVRCPGRKGLHVGKSTGMNFSDTSTGVHCTSMTISVFGFAGLLPQGLVDSRTAPY